MREKPEAGALSRGWGVFSYIPFAGGVGAIWIGGGRRREGVCGARVCVLR